MGVRRYCGGVLELGNLHEYEFEVCRAFQVQQRLLTAVDSEGDVERRELEEDAGEHSAYDRVAEFPDEVAM